MAEQTHRDPPSRDEIDPELVALARPRTGVGPLLVLAVVGLTAYLMVTLHADLRYWLGPRAPRDLGDASAALARGLPDNAYVRLRARPDRTAPGRLRGRQDAGHRLMPVLGTSGRLWLHIHGEAQTTSPRYDEVYEGRLRRVEDVAFAGALRTFVDRLPLLPRFLDPRGIGAATQGGPIRDVAGDAVSVGADSPVEIEERVAGVGEVTLLRSEALPDLAAAVAALGRVEGIPAELPAPVATAEHGWTWELPAPGGLAELDARLAAAKVYTIIQPKIVLHRGAWRELGIQGGALRLGAAVVPLDSVEHVLVLAPWRLPADALVLLEGDVPRTYWYVPVVTGALGLLSAILLWALVRSLRPERPLPPSAAPPPAPGTAGGEAADKPS